MKKRILIINTGGTISSVKTSRGYEPSPGFVKKALAQIGSLTNAEMPDYVIKEYQPLLDSSNMNLNHWNQIAKDIADNYEGYAGFVIFHGTDTMAYTASALSFLLENLSKPVIVTGSQIPMSEVRNDAMENVISSFWLAAKAPIHEVCIYFNHKLLRGNRAQKIGAQQLDAFDSPNFPHLANVGISIDLHKNLLIPTPKKAFHLQSIHPQSIANIRLFPGFMTEVLADLLNQPLQGLVLETYGAGNAPNNDPQFLKLLKEASDKGVVLVNCTQCQRGAVEMGQYATGYTLKKAGLISGHDMTLEAAHCKLLYLLSKNISNKQVKVMMERNLCGELTLGR